MELVFRVHDRKTFVIYETVGAEDVERQILVRMRPAFLVPLSADGGGVAVGIEEEPLASRRENVSEDFPSYL
jgi:hypothetical protein